MKGIRRLAFTTPSRAAEIYSLPSQASICVFCQQPPLQSQRPRRTPFTTSTRHAASDNPSFLERTRQRIWGTTTPPGPADPFARPANTQSTLGDGPEGDYALADEERARDDARLYMQQLQREEKAAWQAQVDDAPMHEDYIPATTWDGLEMVGGEKEWDTGRRFQGFLPGTKLESSEEITVAIYRAVIEIFAALSTKRTPRTSRMYDVGALLTDAVHVRVDITGAGDPDGEGRVRLRYPSQAVERAVLRAGSPALTASTIGTLDNVGDGEVGTTLQGEASHEAVQTTQSSPLQADTAAHLDALIQSWGRSWLRIPLQDAKIKFALVKRITRLTGLHIPDKLIHESDTVAALVAGLIRPKPATKLFEAVMADGRFTQLGNVRIMPRRETPIDKQRQVGRWKLIETELTRRDLPVVGRG